MGSECSACGVSVADNETRYNGLKHNVFFFHSTDESLSCLNGSKLCWGCASWRFLFNRDDLGVSAKQLLLADRIRARRAEQQGPVVVDADGVPIRVGDRVTHELGGPGTVTAVVSDVSVAIQYDEGTFNCAGRLMVNNYASNIHHLAPPAAEKGCRYCGDQKHTQENCEALHGSKNDPAASRATAKPLHSGLPPGEQLKAFTSAVNQHLLPRLPAGFRCVTDVVGRAVTDDGKLSFESKNPCFVVWVIDESGAEIHHANFFCIPSDLGALEVARAVAAKLLSRAARTQPPPPKPPSEWDSYGQGGAKADAGVDGEPMSAEAYRGAFDKLKERVRAVAKAHPKEFMTLTDPWKMLDLGLNTFDLDCSLAQAAFAMRDVQRELRASPPEAADESK